MPALSGGTILYVSRSAKSVACSRLKVIGVSRFFFLPAFVAAFTSADEFHSVTNTRCPAAASHLPSSPSCVVFPEPSMPSTTKSLPGYWCGVVSMFAMCQFLDALHLEAHRASYPVFERGRLTLRRPQFELGVTAREQAQRDLLRLGSDLDVGDLLRARAIQPFGDPDEAREDAHRASERPRQGAESIVVALWRRPPVVTGDEGDHFNLLRLEAAQPAILDQVVRMPMVFLVTDVHAHVVE